MIPIRLQLSLTAPSLPHLQEDRPVPGHADLASASTRLAHGEHVVPIGLDARDVVLPHHVVLRGRRRPLRRRPHPVLVVLDHEDLREVPQLRHVRRLPHLALVARAVAEHRHADVRFPLGNRFVAVMQHVKVLLREGQTRSHGGLRAHDAGTAEEVLFWLVHMHRTSFAVGGTRCMAKQLIDHGFHTGFACAHAEKLDSVATVTGDPVVVWFDCLIDTSTAGFLDFRKVKPDILLHRRDAGIHEFYALHTRDHSQSPFFALLPYF